MAEVVESTAPRRRVDWELWVRRFCALVVAGVAAFASFAHQRDFALRGGADALSAWLWPFSVDGLLVLATVAMLKSDATTSRRGRVAAWLSFGLGVAVSLAANVAAAPALPADAGSVAVAQRVGHQLVGHQYRVVDQDAGTARQHLTHQMTDARGRGAVQLAGDAGVVGLLTRQTSRLPRHRHISSRRD